ncbi:hypothetical protein QCA50_016719 [Cerrena zonata]|uniref:Uncharacterized protein n=1 Tax=Cerrena zonata TaxID=2478898 RepID=A0AAW0FME1_9APHY
MVSWVITGSNRGIGLAFVQRLSSDPTNVIFALTRNKANSTALRDLESKKDNVHVLQADITDVPSLRESAKEVEKRTGGTLDVLINNAAQLTVDRGYWSLDMYDGKEDLLDEDCNRFIEVNVLGVIKTINVFLPLLRKAAEQSFAKVITISSAAGDLDFTSKTGMDYFAPYSISKAAVNMVAAKYAATFKDQNMAFISLSPGVVNTISDKPKEVQDAVYGKLIKDFRAGCPDWNGVFMLPDESVAAMLDTISKLTSKDSGAFITHRGDTKDWL